ncbi:MAG: NUDIX domain-containing protein [Chloroflexi bacterium]|nr:MAG: NUDIX domain-containing protein [Chloroflexota bacterium]
MMSELIKTRTALLKYLRSVQYDKPKFRIAVEGLIFTSDGKLLLEKRGPNCRDEVGKLEGVGGSLPEGREDLLQELYEEFDQEIGAQQQHLKIAIDRLLEIRPVQFMQTKIGQLEDWVVVSFLCRLVEGQPIIGEPDKIESLHYLTMDELFSMDEALLSNSTIGVRKIYREKYGNRPYYDVPEEDPV